MRFKFLCKLAVCVPAFMLAGCFLFKSSSAFGIPEEQRNQIKNKDLLEDIVQWAERFDKLEERHAKVRSYTIPLKRGLIRKLYDIGDNPCSASAVADNYQAIEVAARNILAENNIILNLDDPIDREFIDTLFSHVSVKEIYSVYENELECYKDELERYNKPSCLFSKEVRRLKQAWDREETPRRFMFDETCFPVSALNRFIFKPVLQDSDGSFFKAQSGMRIISREVMYEPVPEFTNEDASFEPKNAAMEATLSVIFRKSCSFSNSHQKRWSFFGQSEQSDILRSKSRDSIYNS